jgi:hypothetical protein
MNILTALIPLLGVVVGVTATYIVSGRSERLRHEYELKKHELELRERWDRTELDAYADYLGCAAVMASLAGKASGARGFNDRAVKADLDTVLKALNEVETRRGVAFERVALLGEDQTIKAGHRLNEALWKMEWFARGLIEGSPEKWEAAADEYIKVLIEFHRAARARLSIFGEFNPKQEIVRPDVLGHACNRPHRPHFGRPAPLAGSSWRPA